MKIEDTISVEPVLRQAARHRFYYLHETKENLMAQLKVSKLELEMMLRPSPAVLNARRLVSR